MKDRITDVRRELAANCLQDAEEKIEEARLALLQAETFDVAADLRALRRSLRSILYQLNKLL